MLIGVIQVTDYDSALAQLNVASRYATGIEFRLDYLPSIDINIVTKLRDACPLPVIFTLRKQSQGGHYQHSETQRLLDISTLCSLTPDYFDLEFDIDTNFIESINNK